MRANHRKGPIYIYIYIQRRRGGKVRDNILSTQWRWLQGKERSFSYYLVSYWNEEHQ